MTGNCGEPSPERGRNEHFHAAFDGLPIGVADLDFGGRVLRANPRLAELAGLPCAELRGRRLAELMRPEPGPPQALSGWEPGQALPPPTEVRLLRPDGSGLWARLTLSLQPATQGRAAHLVALLEDVDDCRRAREDLQQSGERSRRVADLLPVGMYACDAEGLITFFNRRAAELWGREPRLGDPGMRFGAAVRSYTMEGAPLPWAGMPMACAVREGRSLRDQEFLIEQPDGRCLPVLLNVDPLRDADGTVTGAVAAFFDLSQQKRAEQEAARRAEQQALLLEVTRSLLEAGQDEAAVARCVFDKVAAHLGADFCVNYRLDPVEGVLERVAGFGLPEGLGVAASRLEAGGPACGTTEAPGAARIVELQHGALARHGAVGAGSPLGAYACHPLLARDGSVMGTFALGGTSRGPFSEDEAGFIQALCRYVALDWERIRFEQALRRREEQLRVVLDAGRLGTWWRDLRSGELHLDPRARAHFGFEADTVGPQEHLARVHPEDVERLRREMAEADVAPPGEDNRSIEHRLLLPDGSVRWLAVQAKTFPGSAVRIGTTADITERKRVERALEETAADLERAQAMADVGSWRIDVRSGALHWSRQVYRIFGLPPATPIDYERFIACVHPEDRDKVEAAWDAAVASRGVYDIEHRILVGDEVRWVREKAELDFDAQGQLRWGFGTVQHITGLKQAEAALRESEARFRELADAMPQMVWQSTADGTAYEYFNEQYRTRVNDACGGDWACVLHPEDRQRTLDAWARAVAEEALYEIEHRVRHEDGSWHWYLSRAVPVRDAAGALRHWYGTSTDIDALKEAEAAVKEADRRKDEFLATLAHELRNPLAPLRNAAQMLGLHAQSDPALQWTAGVVERQVSHLARLIDDLLDVSRISRDKLELRRERVLLRSIVDGALEASLPQVEAHQHVLTIELPPQEVPIEGDPVRLVQIFQNLLDNAAKYTPPGGRLGLSARCDGPWVEVSVRDNGLGIPPESQARLFELFYQVDRTLERSRGGLGIGLTLVQRLVRMHGGTIEVRSPGRGLGSTFVVRLPVCGNPAAAQPAGPAAADAAAAAPVRHLVLVADDNVDSAESMALLLQIAGHEVHVAHDGLQAVARAEQLRPTLILLDIGMPGLNGYEAARRIRASDWGRRVLLVAQTGWGQQEDVRRSQEAGFDAHLTKPVDLEALMALLERKAIVER